EAECKNDELKADCKTVRPIFSKYCDNAASFAGGDYVFPYSQEKDRDELVDKINGWPAAKKRYDAFHAKWKKCYGREEKAGDLEAASYAKCDKAPAAMKTLVRNAVVEALRRHTLKDVAITGNTNHAHLLAEEAKKTATELLAMLAKIPTDYQAEKPALEALIVQADKIFGAADQADAEAVKASGCPSGSGTLSGAHKSLVASKFTAKESKIVRQMGAQENWRDGLISKQKIPVAVCGEEKGGGGKICHAWELVVIREKPPGGEWTSWFVRMDGDYQINCAKLR